MDPSPLRGTLKNNSQSENQTNIVQHIAVLRFGTPMRYTPILSLSLQENRKNVTNPNAYSANS